MRHRLNFFFKYLKKQKKQNKKKQPFMQAEKYPEKNNKKDRINRKSVQVKHTL